MTRVWLPGRARLSTAWRSGNHRARRERPRRAHEQPRRAVEHGGDHGEAARDERARRAAMPACHDATATRPAVTTTAVTTCTQSIRPTSDRSPKSVRDTGGSLRLPVRRPQQQQGLDPSDFEQRHEREQQRHQQPDRHALKRSPTCVSPYGTPPNEAVSDAGIIRIATAASSDADQAAGQAEQRHLRDVGRQHLRRGRADALQDRDALDLLPHEDARHAPHADAAEHDDDEADEAQVVLGAKRDPRRCRLRATVGAGRDEVAAQLLAQTAGQRDRRRPRGP